MRILAALFAVALLVVPFAACGSGGGGGGCSGVCAFCSSSFDCCGSALCSNATTDGFARCINFDFQCKVGD